MTAYHPIQTDHRTLAEIDALQRALRNLHHWTATAHARRGYADDRGRRLFSAASGMRDRAWADSLEAAYALFEIDALHRAWLDTREAHR